VYAQKNELNKIMTQIGPTDSNMTIETFFYIFLLQTILHNSAANTTSAPKAINVSGHWAIEHIDR
jgi:hypothetical protein